MPIFIVNGVLVAAPNLSRAAQAFEQLKKEPAIHAEKVAEGDEVLTADPGGPAPQRVLPKKKSKWSVLDEPRRRDTPRGRAKRQARAAERERVLGTTVLKRDHAPPAAPAEVPVGVTMSTFGKKE